MNYTLCLNMIVKNESNTITRLLDSIVDYIDYYCICDTGSTDDTVEIIETYFKNKKINGIIIHKSFVDFSYNRNFALRVCHNINVKYILLLDADMVFNITLTKEKLYEYLNLNYDLFYVFQGENSFYYKNIRIIKNIKTFNYIGVTHECIDINHIDINNINIKTYIFDKKDIFIYDIGDGGCKINKYSRDIKLLVDGLIKEPNNARYLFYLANSYKDTKQYENAIEQYKKRILENGWIDEMWISYYNIGICYKYLNDMPNAIFNWLNAFNLIPNRIENLYEIINYYRINKQYNIAYDFYIIANNIKNKLDKNILDNYLFLQKDIYDYKLDFEFTIIGFYCNYLNYDINKSFINVLNYSNLNKHAYYNILDNLKYYIKNNESITYEKIQIETIDLLQIDFKYNFLNNMKNTTNKLEINNETYLLYYTFYDETYYYCFIVVDLNTNELIKHSFYFLYNKHIVNNILYENNHIILYCNENESYKIYIEQLTFYDKIINTF